MNPTLSDLIDSAEAIIAEHQAEQAERDRQTEHARKMKQAIQGFVDVSYLKQLENN